MIVESDYRGYRIEVVAFEIEGAGDADVRIRRNHLQEAPARETP
jgi:hypothetical protein